MPNPILVQDLLTGPEMNRSFVVSEESVPTNVTLARLTIAIEVTRGKDGYTAYCNALDLVTSGDTQAEATESMFDAIEEYLGWLEEDRDKLGPKYVEHLQYKYLPTLPIELIISE